MSQFFEKVVTRVIKLLERQLLDLSEKGHTIDVSEIFTIVVREFGLLSVLFGRQWFLLGGLVHLAIFNITCSNGQPKRKAKSKSSVWSRKSE